MEIFKLNVSGGGILVVIIALVDKKPILMVLDTGASHSILDINWAQKNLPKKEIIVLPDAGSGMGSTFDVYKAKVASFNIGEKTLTSRTFMLTDLGTINSAYDKEGFDPVYGMLGGDILNEFGVIIDYGKMKLKFKK